jgi:hypothetical protein
VVKKYPVIPANTGKFLPVSVSVFGVPNTGIPVSVYTGLETLAPAYYTDDILLFDVTIMQVLY